MVDLKCYDSEIDGDLVIKAVLESSLSETEKQYLLMRMYLLTDEDGECIYGQTRDPFQLFLGLLYVSDDLEEKDKILKTLGLVSVSEFFDYAELLYKARQLATEEYGAVEM